MAYWAFALQQEGGVDALLDKWDPEAAPSGPSEQTAAPPSSGKQNTAGALNSSPSIGIAEDDSVDDAPEASTSKQGNAGSTSLTLEQLLDEDDLLQELKNGHAKLLDFLSMPSTIKRILDYISGEAFAEAPTISPPPLHAATNGDDKSGPQSPSKSLISLAEQVRRVLAPQISEEEKEASRKRLKYPFLCMEILAAYPWQITDTIFGDTDQYLLPFWDAVLDKVPQELAEISVHAGHWSKVNIHWLSSARAPQLVQFLKTVHDLFPRMLRHLPYVSPIFDVLVKLANTDETHPQLGIIEWLHNAKLIPQVLELLDPVSSPMEAHAPASEFLRSLIAATSAAVAAKQQQQQQEAAKMGEINSESLGLTMSSAAWSNWPNNTLVRELASQRTMDTLLGYMLDVQPSDTTDTNGHDSSADTPTSSTFPKSQSSPTRRASREAITSSLLNSLTVIIDIIRKNNSDFTELQIFHFLERTSGGSETGERIGLEGEGEEGFVLQDQGPSLVDLEPLLRSITGRLGDLNRLLTHPRSDITPHPTNLQGTKVQEPLTFERFRICELYAELIHCSNMAILNREAVNLASQDRLTLPEYDAQSGRILGTRQEAYAKLSRALNVSPAASPSMPSMGDSSHHIHDEGLGEDMGPAGSMMNGRPVTAESNATSSYDSETETISQGKDDSEDMFDQIHVGTEDLSLDSETGSSMKASSAPSSPMPPSESAFSPTSTSSPGHAKQPSESNTYGSAKQTPPSSADGSAQLSSPPLPAGPALKKAFIDLEVVPTVLDLFFKFPWNNSLHNVVYDLIQQIFNGKLDEGMNRDLCAAVFTQRQGLVDRILQAIKENDEIAAKPHGVRLGHMGHLTLITEEVVKLFYNHGKSMGEIPPLPALEEASHSKQWREYIGTTFRETRERDLQPLGGGISVGMHPSASTGSGGHGIGLVEIDDEFPQVGSRGVSANDQEGSPDTDPEKAHFARYLASQISSDFQSPQAHNSLHRSTSSSSSSGSSSSDEILEDASSPTSRQQASRTLSGTAGLDSAASTWFSPREGDSAFDDYDDEEEEGSGSGNAFGNKNRWHGDFDIGVSPQPQSQTRKIHESSSGPHHHGRQDKFGFDDRFDAAQFGSADSEDDALDGEQEEEDEDGFGPFSDSFAAAPSPGVALAGVKGYTFDDDFASTSQVQHTVVREKLTPADWNSSFRSNYDGVSPSFGEFGETSSTESPMPSPNGDFQIEDDDDFGDFASGDANNHGDYDFTQTDASPPKVDSISSNAFLSSTSPSKSPPTRQMDSGRPPIVPIPGHKRSASSIEREHKGKSVTSPVSPGQEIHGPGIHEGAHISMDGTHVEAEIEVDGKMVTVQVPKDELALHPDLVED